MTGSPPIPVQNQTPRNKPEGWFYNGQILRSDTQVAHDSVAGGAAGTFENLIEFAPGNFQWTIDRLIVSAFLDIVLEVTPVALWAEAGVYIVRNDAAVFAIPSSNTGIPGEGGASGALLGASIAANHPGTAATTAVATKTVGINFYPAPFYVPAKSPVKIMYYLTSGGVAAFLYTRATIFSVPAG